jgi:sucrose-6F-phosphate phosphohydrolase
VLVSAPFRSLLAVDLDGTMVGDPVALAELNGELGRLRGHVALAYVTGRHLESTLQLMAETGLLTPDAIVTGVGTAVHHGPAWHSDRGWHRLIAPGWSAERVRAAAAFFPELTPQPTSHQGPFKQSYTLEGPGAARTIASLADAMRRQGLRTRLVYSSGVDLDVVPAKAGKGHAVRYLARSFGLGLADTLVCGDSGNDHEMLSLGGPAAMVANARPELASLPPTVYRARTPYAAGVHEALRHFGWL